MMIGNMGDVATLTDKLALLSDQMLPRLAQQYKNDAITLSLILSEKNRRDRVRKAMQAQAGAQPQPKVNDQIVAGMQQLPENVGIGALPAPSMQQMADGGIAGYPDGDLIASNEPVIRMADGGIARFAGEGPSVVRSRTSWEDELARLQDYEEDPNNFWTYNSDVAAAKERAKKAEAAKSAPSPRDDTFRRKTDPRMLGVPATAPETAPDAALAKTDYSILSNLMGEQAPRGAGGVRAQTPTDFASMYNKIYKDTVAEDPAAKEREALGRELVSGAEGRLRRLKEEQAARGDVYKGREERLTAREKELAKAGEKNTGLALLEAGLAIMSTPGTLAQAIGKGARAGTAKYSEGLDKLRAAQERLNDARDRIEDLRINRDDMNARELRQANNEIDNAKTDARKLGIEGIMAAAGVKEKRAGAMFDATVKQALTREEIQGRKEIAGMEAASRERLAMMPGANERIALLLGGGNLEKGLTRLADIQAGKFNPTTAYTEYLSKRKEGDTVLSPQEFVTQIRSVQMLMAGAPSASKKPTGKIYE